MFEESARGVASPWQRVSILALGHLPMGQLGSCPASGVSCDGARVAEVVQPSSAKTCFGQEVRGRGGEVRGKGGKREGRGSGDWCRRGR